MKKLFKIMVVSCMLAVTAANSYAATTGPVPAPTRPLPVATNPGPITVQAPYNPFSGNPPPRIVPVIEPMKTIRFLCDMRIHLANGSTRPQLQAGWPSVKAIISRILTGASAQIATNASDPTFNFVLAAPNFPIVHDNNTYYTLYKYVGKDVRVPLNQTQLPPNPFIAINANFPKVTGTQMPSVEISTSAPGCDIETFTGTVPPMGQ